MKSMIMAIVLGILCIWPQNAPAEESIIPVHAFAMHGKPKYGPGFTHFDYVNPNAPKGGDARLSAIGTYDNLNAFILKGHGAVGLGLIYDTLLTSSYDEAFTKYGLLVESIEMPQDRSWVAFTLREEARWHDGRQITVEDVIFTIETLKTNADDPAATFFFA